MYRILQIRDGRPTTLFHGVNGSRTLPIDEWIEAEVEEVHDGSGGTTYQSGFHVMPSRKDAVEYLKRFEKERPLVVCRVLAKETWPKSHANADVRLARQMFISPMYWAHASNPLGEPMPLGEHKTEAKEYVADYFDNKY